MKQDITSIHNTDDNGNPTGGSSQSTGITVFWQDGPLMVDGVRVDPTGGFVETLIAIAMDRIEFYQDSKFNCPENEAALGYLQRAMASLERRTADREARQVEGTHAV